MNAEDLDLTKEKIEEQLRRLITASTAMEHEIEATLGKED